MLEILDTTLRDGEQTSGVSFASHEKLSITRVLLDDVKINRIEIASARVSAGEYDAVKHIISWANTRNHLDKIEVLGFVDGKVSVDWIASTGGKVLNLLTKGSLKHATEQLKKTPQQHADDIAKVVAYAQTKGISVNVYLEDWSNGIKNSPDYVYFMMDKMKGLPIKRFMLPDTLGILNPEQTYIYCRKMVERFPNLHFDFHAHNDYDMAVANVYAAVKAGVKGIHTTVNGLGERAGNAPLSSVQAVIHDLLGIQTSVQEDELNRVSKLVETYSGIRIPGNKPVIGENVFTQCAGVHADGDNKNNLYFNELLPERFGRERVYALGKTSGKANIQKNLESLGVDLDDATMKLVTEKIIELGDKKEMVTQEDLPYIISDVLKTKDIEQKIKVLNYSLSLSQGLKPVATINIEINGHPYQETSAGDGQYDAFMKALWKIYDQLNRPHPILTDYAVNIPPGGRTDALVQTTISWTYNDRNFKTHGLDGDQTVAAIKATIKMLNMIENW